MELRKIEIQDLKVVNETILSRVWVGGKKSEGLSL